jgi:hypothetical protein
MEWRMVHGIVHWMRSCAVVRCAIMPVRSLRHRFPERGLMTRLLSLKVCHSHCVCKAMGTAPAARNTCVSSRCPGRSVHQRAARHRARTDGGAAAVCATGASARPGGSYCGAAGESDLAAGGVLNSKL